MSIVIIAPYRRFLILPVLTVGCASHIWSICISCLQDDVYKAGGGGRQRLRVRRLGGWAHRYQRSCGGQQTQSEGTEGSRGSN